MKRLALLVSVLLCSCSSADAYWFWPFPNPELASWYATYTGPQGMTITPATKPQAIADLRTIMATYPAIPPRMGVVNGQVVQFWPTVPFGQEGPHEEAQMILETISTATYKWPLYP